MAWVDLKTLHNPKPGVAIPSAWADGVISDFAVFSEREAAAVVTNEGTSSTTFADLATVGPAVTVATGTRAMCFFTMQCLPSADFIVSIAVSGATTIAANEDNALIYSTASTSSNAVWSGIGYFSALTAGNNTFTVKYKVSSGTANFLRRKLLVIPLI